MHTGSAARFGGLSWFRFFRRGALSALLLAGPACAHLNAAATLPATTVLPGAAVGQSSASTTVTITAVAAGTVANVMATTQGEATSEFVLDSTGTCAGASLLAGTQCAVTLHFQPLYPGQRLGAVLLTDSNGSLLGRAVVSAVATGPLSVLKPGMINTVVGDGDWLYHGDGMAAVITPIFLPTAIIADAAGNLYLSDSSNNRIRRVGAASPNIVTTVVGTGVPSLNADGGIGTAEGVSSPSGLVLDGSDDLFFVDSGNMCVRRLDSVTQVVTTVAGTCGVSGYSGDGGPATSATLALPEGLAMDPTGNLYIADTNNNAVRRVDAVTGIITTIAGGLTPGLPNGNGIPALGSMLNQPWGLTVDSTGQIFIADLGDNRIRKIDTAGLIWTVAGTGTAGFAGDGGSATQALLFAPAAVALDPAGNLYIGDSGNNRIREVSAANGNINTLSGTTVASFGGDLGRADLATLYGPYALDIDQNGNLLLADMFHNRIREIYSQQLPLSFATIRVSKLSPVVPIGVENDGNATENISTIPLVNAQLDPGTTTCAAGALNTALECTLGIEFAPTTVGTVVDGSVTVNSDAVNSPNVVSLSGQVLTVNPTSVALISSNNPSLLNSSVTFTATVSSSDSSIGGTISFLDGSSVICNAVTLSGFSATCTTSALALGTHSITASYTGDSDNAASVSPALSQVVKQPSTVALTAAPNPAVVTQTVTLTATITATSSTPTGTVQFLDNGVAIGAATLGTSSNTATFTTSSLSAGTHTLTASYSGDNATAAGQSSAVSEVVNLATTLTTLSTSAATAPVGTAITFTANVSSTNGPAPTGLVSFSDGSTSLGSGAITTVSGVSTATFTTALLAPGVHQIVATYAGDSDNASSSSTGLAETIQQIGTVTTLGADINPASAGATVTFTANVALAPGATADGAIAGTVTFTDGSTTLGTATVDATGKATLQTNKLAVGPHSIVASYGGNTNYAASASTALTETVQATSTATTLSVTGTGLAGKTLTLSASVTSTTGVPTGTIRFMDGSTLVATGTLNAQGTVSVTTTTLAVGSHQLTAVYSGDANYVASTSAPVPQVIVLATPQIVLAGPASPLNAGVAANFTASITTDGVATTGALTLHDGATAISAQSISGTGSFTFSSSALSVGSHTLTVTYGGDANNAVATSNTVTLVVQQGSTSTSLSTSKSPQLLGQSVTFSATVTSPSPNITGNVNFYDGGTLIGSSGVGTGGVATLSTSSLTFGAHTITATYSGDTNHTGSTAPALTQQIVESVNIGLTSSANPSVVGASVTFTVKVAGSASAIPTGAVTLLDGSSLLATVTLDATGTATFSTTNLAVGSHILTASYPGDTNYGAATSAAVTQTVINSNTQVALTSSANPATFGAALTFTAVVTSNGGLATGTVNFTDAGTKIGSAVLDSTGTARLTLSTLAPGTHSIVASYVGDGKASPSVSSPLAQVVKQTTAVAVASNANPAQTLTAVTFTAVVTNAGQDIPSGAVTFSDGGSQIGTAQLDPTTGIATLTVPQLSAGAHAITAAYAGNGTNFAANSPTLTETITLRATQTTLTASAANPNNSQEITLIGVVRYTGPSVPTGTITFTSGSSTLGSVPVDSTGVATLVITVGSGPENVVATYSGDTAYSGSASAATSVGPIPSPEFTIAASPSTVTLQSKQHSTITLTLTSSSSFADTLSYGCLGLPYAATCTFSQTSGKLTAGGTTQVQVVIDTGNPLGAGGTASLRSGPSTVLMCFLPASLAAGLLLFRRRRARFTALLAAVFAAVLAFGATGCGSITVNGTPAGNYTFQVTARGVNTGVAEAQNITLNVTQ